MCCNTGHNLNLVAPPPGRPHQITILRHQGHSRVFMIINSIIKIIIISSNSSTFIIIIISNLAMMMISGGFSYGGFSYSYILRSYFGCMPWSWSSRSSSSSSSNVKFHAIVKNQYVFLILAPTKSYLPSQLLSTVARTKLSPNQLTLQILQAQNTDAMQKPTKIQTK